MTSKLVDRYQQCTHASLDGRDLIDVNLSYIKYQVHKCIALKQRKQQTISFTQMFVLSIGPRLND